MIWDMLQKEKELKPCIKVNRSKKSIFAPKCIINPNYPKLFLNNLRYYV